MADLRSTAQSVLIEAREGIAWIAFYKRGRGWDAEAFWPEYDEQSNSFKFEEWDVEDVKEILATDADHGPGAPGRGQARQGRPREAPRPRFAGLL